MILHLEPKKPNSFAELIGLAIGVHVREVSFQTGKGKSYRSQLSVIMDPDLHPAALLNLADMVIMKNLKTYEFVGIEAITQEPSDPLSCNAMYETVIRAIFINKR